MCQSTLENNRCRISAVSPMHDGAVCYWATLYNQDIWQNAETLHDTINSVVMY